MNIRVLWLAAVGTAAAFQPAIPMRPHLMRSRLFAIDGEAPKKAPAKKKITPVKKPAEKKIVNGDNKKIEKIMAGGDAAAVEDPEAAAKAAAEAAAKAEAKAMAEAEAKAKAEAAAKAAAKAKAEAEAKAAAEETERLRVVPFGDPTSIKTPIYERVGCRWLDVRAVPDPQFDMLQLKSVKGHSCVKCPVTELEARSEGCLGRNKEIPILIFGDGQASCKAAKIILEQAGFTRVVSSGEWAGGKLEDMVQLRNDIFEGSDAMRLYKKNGSGPQSIQSMWGKDKK